MQEPRQQESPELRIEIYRYDGKLFKRTALEPYLFNIILKEKTKGDLYTHARIMLDVRAKLEIEQQADEIISELQPELMTAKEYQTMLDANSTNTAREAELGEGEEFSDSYWEELEAKLDKHSSINIEKTSSDRLSIEPKNNYDKKSSDSSHKKSSFTAPNEDDAIFGIEEDEDHTQLYGKVGAGDQAIPGAKILACLSSPEIIPPEHREKFIRYRESAISVLQQELSKIEPENYNVSTRNKFYLISLLLSEKGVAPRWREYKRVFVDAGSLEDSPELVYSRDVQLFDLEWMRRNYPRHKPSKRMNGLYVALTDSEKFDFNHAFIIASSKFTAIEKAKQLRLSETMQLDNFIIRSRQVDRRAKKLENDLDEVHTDLLEACQRNRHRGAQLEKQIPERLSIWLSAQLTHGNSVSAMCDRYQKITGSKISPSSLRRKFQRTQAALLEVDSRHFIRELANL